MNEATRRGLKRGAILALLLLAGLGIWLLLRPAPSAEADPAASYGAAVGGPFTLTAANRCPLWFDGHNPRRGP